MTVYNDSAVIGTVAKVATNDGETDYTFYDNTSYPRASYKTTQYLMHAFLDSINKDGTGMKLSFKIRIFMSSALDGEGGFGVYVTDDVEKTTVAIVPERLGVLFLNWICGDSGEKKLVLLDFRKTLRDSGIQVELEQR